MTFQDTGLSKTGTAFFIKVRCCWNFSSTQNRFCFTLQVLTRWNFPTKFSSNLWFQGPGVPTFLPFLAEKIYKDQNNFFKAPLKLSNFKTANHSKTWIQLEYGGEEGEQLHGSFKDMNIGFWIILPYTMGFFFNSIAAFQNFKKKDWALIL